MIISTAVLMLCTQYALSGAATLPTKPINELNFGYDPDRTPNDIHSNRSGYDVFERMKIKILQHLEAPEREKLFQAIPDMTTEKAQIVNMFAKKSNVNTFFMNFPKIFNLFAEEFIKAKYNALGNDMGEITKFIDNLNSTEYSARCYLTLYNYLNNTQSFNLCDRIKLLTAVNNIMLSPNFTSVSKSTQEKLSALVEGLPQSLRGLTGGSSLHISDRTGTTSLFLDQTEEIKDRNLLQYMIHVSADKNPTKWIFVPETQNSCEFRIRTDCRYGYELYTSSYRENYDSERRWVYVSPRPGYHPNAVWRLKDFDWRNNLFTLHNKHYDANLNIDVNDKLAYTPIAEERDVFNVVKLHFD